MSPRHPLPLLTILACLAVAIGSGCLLRPLGDQPAPVAPSASSALAPAAGGGHYRSDWPTTGQHDWIGGDVWPDLAGGWKLDAGEAVCYGAPGTQLRCLTLGSHALTPGRGRFTMTVDITITPGETDCYAGFLLGRPSPYPSPGSQTGKLARVVFAGINTRGDALVAANPSHARLANWIAQSTNTAATTSRVRLQLHGLAIGASYALVLTCRDLATGVELARDSLWDVPPQLVRGFTALGTGPIAPGEAGRCRFSRLELKGEKVITHSASAGPILGAWHTITAGTLQMRVQLAPLGEATPTHLSLDLAEGTNWIEAVSAPVDRATATSLIELADWASRPATDYRLRATIPRGERVSLVAIYHGTIAADPRGGDVALAILPPPPDTGPFAWQPPPYGLRTISPYDPRLAPVLAAGCRGILTPGTPMGAPTPKNLQQRYLWAIAYATAGRTLAFPNTITPRSAYGGLGIVPFSGRPPAAAWEHWIGADALLNWSPATLDETARRLAPSIPAPPSHDATIDMVGIMPQQKMIVMDRLIAPTGATAHRQTAAVHSDGWPLGTPIDPSQTRKPIGYLPPVQVTGVLRPVVQLIDEGTGQTIQLIRLEGQAYLPRVYTNSSYTIHIAAPEQGKVQTLTGQTITRLGEAETALISF